MAFSPNSSVADLQGKFGHFEQSFAAKIPEGSVGI
jgi:hypothetical protein